MGPGSTRWASDPDPVINGVIWNHIEISGVVGAHLFQPPFFFQRKLRTTWESYLEIQKPTYIPPMVCFFEYSGCIGPYGCFLNWWYPQIIHLNNGFPLFSPSIFWGNTTIFGKHPNPDWFTGILIMASYTHNITG